MTKTERKIQFDIALEIVQKVFTDYCKDQDVTREQAQNFNNLIQDMIHFSGILKKESKTGKYEYNKHNVLVMLEDKERQYNQKWVKATNEHNQEKAKQFLEMKTAIQNLIIDFEEEFE